MKWKNDSDIKNSRHRKLFVPMLLALVLAACSGLTRSDKPAVSTWLLKPYDASQAATAPDSKTRVAVLISVSPGLDTDWILTLSADAELNHYSGARWVENLPELVSSLTRRTLESSGRFSVVSNGGGHEDCKLLLEVQAFYAAIDSTNEISAVELLIAGEYVCETGEPVAIQLDATVAVQDENIASIVAAFQRASDKVMSDLLALIG